MKRFVLELIKLYQSTVSQVIPPACRFQPTCSHYTYEAIQKYGIVKGGMLAAKRIGRCHPWSTGGLYLVP